jgi:MFS family permease
MTTTPATPADPAQTDENRSAEQPEVGPRPGGSGASPGDQPPAPPTRDRLHGFRALRHPGFRLYFMGMLFRGAAMWMPLVAIPWLAVQLGATPAEVGIVTGFFFLPTLFVGPWSGVIADRVERRNMLIVSQLLAAALSSAIVLLVASESHTVPLLMASSFGFGVLVSFEVPVRQAFMTEMVPHADIPSAASLHATAWNTMRLVGPVLAGLMIASFGSWSPFAFGATSSLLVAGSIVWMDRYRQPGRRRADASGSVLSDLRGGLSFALHDPVVRLSLMSISATALLGIATFATLAPLYAQQELGLDADGFGAFVGASGAGALSAALLVTALARGDRRPWMIAGLLSMAALVAGIGLVGSTMVVFVFAFLLGAAQITLAQNALVSVHSATPDDVRGRVMGLWVMTFQGSSLIGSLLSGWLADLLGVRTAMLAAAFALALVGLAATVAIRRADWRLAPAQPAGT